MDNTRSRRRWVQFSLKAILIATTVLALWLGRTVIRTRNQAAVVAEVQAGGGAVWFETDQYRFVEYWQNPERIPSKATSGPTWLRDIIGEEYFRDIVQIDFTTRPGKGVSSQDLVKIAPRLRKLPMLETLRLDLENSGDDTLVRFIESSSLTQLKNLCVDSLVTDSELERISALRGLEALNLRYTHVTDEGAVHLSNLDNLHSLVLYSAKLTDRGIRNILALPHLKKLILYDCAITESQLAALAEDYPHVDASIYFTPSHGIAE